MSSWKPMEDHWEEEGRGGPGPGPRGGGGAKQNNHSTAKEHKRTSSSSSSSSSSTSSTSWEQLFPLKKWRASVHVHKQRPSWFLCLSGRLIALQVQTYSDLLRPTATYCGSTPLITPLLLHQRVGDSLLRFNCLQVRCDAEGCNKVEEGGRRWKEVEEGGRRGIMEGQERAP